MFEITLTPEEIKIVEQAVEEKGKQIVAEILKWGNLTEEIFRELGHIQTLLLTLYYLQGKRWHYKRGWIQKKIGVDDREIKEETTE